MKGEFTSMFQNSMSLHDYYIIDHASPRVNPPIRPSPSLVSFEDDACNIIRANYAIGQKKQQSSPCSSWINRDYECLPEIPLLYPIERTNTVVQCSDPHLIADRIICSLQKLSITANFNASDASLCAETLDHTEFYVRMYKYKNQDILVEVQRSKGESFNYVKYARVILASARGDEVDFETENRKRSSSASLSYIPASISCNQQDSDTYNETEVSSVHHVEDLIQKDRVDAHQLGMHTLLLLTDCERSLVSESASQVVLQGNENGPSVIKDFVYSLISGPLLNNTSSPCEVDVFAIREQEIMRNTALAVLGNSLQSVSESHPSDLKKLLHTNEWKGNSGIVDVLLSELSNAECRLHDAYQAARCIRILLETSSETKQELLNRNVAATLKDAYLIGVSKHSLLAAECKEALDLISGV
ncbi:hypothetical protein HJC23_003823 [Cyclotella cryptica]|uniref:Uncharacterized protein n=1 Tax=Cyclotella cryptica TaxID=29204 RepID=A0ABD3PYU9_9STRA|eukprot:CCRYP_009968-RA/>CCRYP_009968-RA protein AED:0.09 eAED:0.09 QI:303/1/1/1/1/1/2/176/415